ncbi:MULTISPECIES: helix-turn-helix domain-containing protein [unclassified Enterococcus]|uniref:helix-turn-helix domain-containing protein n=1 Tax=unclassified Enterococcus TaxID=2608891 RepID=UPI001CE0A14B|nr:MULTISPECIES: helix-turn-helix transcriptional regulator [unclassified Enterococcus]MCA5014539.1 helix-turn-helix transcriptional regulator [Enterococcus sp. S23]MCA5017792.1 helix-turn-helix transcriptional regulator [Enterococcus sp. S22(2020)]
MDKRMLGKLVKQLRQDTGLTQAAARENVLDKASYSKFENGHKPIDFNSLLQILSNLKVSFRDFTAMYLEPNWEKTIRRQYENLRAELPSKKAQKEIFEIYDSLSARFPNLEIGELTVYFDIKANFHKNNPTKIAPITPKEQRFILERFYRMNQKAIFEEDYKLISQVVNDLSPDDIMKVAAVVFPIDSHRILSSEIKRHLCNILLNSITPLFFNKEYKKVKALLKIAEKHKFLYSDSYYYLAQFTYLHNLYLYIVKNDTDGFKKVTAVINAIDLIGDKGSAALMDKEVQNLVDGKKNQGFSQYDILIGKN